MINNRHIKFSFLHAIVIIIIGMNLLACRQAYAPPVITANNHYLVVDGFVNMGAGTVSIFNINRTRNLGDSVTAGFPELNAQVSIVGSGGTSYSLIDTAGKGIYNSFPLTLDPKQRYSIAITTSDGSRYASDPAPALVTPAIDSIYWRQPDDFTVYAATHDPSNTIHYYRWDYNETYQHNSQLVSPWAEKNGLIYVTDSTNQETNCWTTDTSTNIIIGNSTALSQDVIPDAAITTIHYGDPRLEIRYSIIVRQYALTSDAYKYWQQIQSTSQALGTLFDPQPNQLVGNIHNLSKPSEPVIGYLSASTVQQQRIFVFNTNLNNWPHNNPLGRGCEDTVVIYTDTSNFLIYNYPNPNFYPYYFINTGILVLANKQCLLCTLDGGTNIKPSFWPF